METKIKNPGNENSELKTYTVLWTYVANHSDHPVVVRAANPTEAVEKAWPFYAHNDKVNFIVIEGEPVLETARTVHITDDNGERRGHITIDYEVVKDVTHYDEMLEEHGRAVADQSFARDAWEIQEDLKTMDQDESNDIIPMDDQDAEQIEKDRNSMGA